MDDVDEWLLSLLFQCMCGVCLCVCVHFGIFLMATLRLLTLSMAEQTTPYAPLPNGFNGAYLVSTTNLHALTMNECTPVYCLAASACAALAFAALPPPSPLVLEAAAAAAVCCCVDAAVAAVSLIAVRRVKGLGKEMESESNARERREGEETKKGTKEGSERLRTYAQCEDDYAVAAISS